LVCAQLLNEIRGERADFPLDFLDLGTDLGMISSLLYCLLILFRLYVGNSLLQQRFCRLGDTSAQL
jgi:hypothetical protein